MQDAADIQRTELAKQVRHLDPADFIATMARFARMNAASSTDAYVREGYEIWAEQYEACLAAMIAPTSSPAR